MCRDSLKKGDTGATTQDGSWRDETHFGDTETGEREEEGWMMMRAGWGGLDEEEGWMRHTSLTTRLTRGGLQLEGWRCSFSLLMKDCVSQQLVKSIRGEAIVARLGVD